MQTPEGPVPDHVPVARDRLNRPVALGDARAGDCRYQGLPRAGNAACQLNPVKDETPPVE